MATQRCLMCKVTFYSYLLVKITFRLFISLLSILFLYSGFQLRLESIIWNCFVFALLRFVIGVKTRATNQMQNQNQSRLGRTRFPALGAGHVYLLRVLNQSINQSITLFKHDKSISRAGGVVHLI